MKKFTSFLLSFLIAASTIAQIRNQNQPTEESEKLNQLAKEFQDRQNRQKTEAIDLARRNNWEVRKELDDGRILEIMKIGTNGMPQYYSTQNLNAARTVFTDDLWVGGISGLNLNGSGYLIGEWDGGGIRR